MPTRKKTEMPIPTVDPTLSPIIRAKIRAYLLAVPKGRKVPVGMIRDGVRALGYDFPEEVFGEAMEWNHRKNFVDYDHNHDFERDEWCLTDKGRAKGE